MKSTPGCTCPSCRKGYYPKSYTFGGNVPPEKPMTSDDKAVAKAIQLMEKHRREIDDALAKLKRPKGPDLRGIR